MKARDHHIYGTADFVNRLKEEYEFLGRQASIVETGHLVVFALPQRKKKVDNQRQHPESGGRDAENARRDRKNQRHKRD